MNFNNFNWINEPKNFNVSENKIELTTLPNTDLWQNTYYGFSHANAHMFLSKTSDEYFTFTVKTDFSGRNANFDQCGIVVFANENNWLKASVESEGKGANYLGSVVTNGGFSDWATAKISDDTSVMYYRLSRRKSDFKIESSQDGKSFSQMRICRLNNCGGEVKFGIYACSPADSSFTAIFSDFEISECKWKEYK